MATSFFFYDVETSGFNPRTARIMQFAGQRTDLQLQPIDKPTNVLIKLTEDILPEPDAILVTKITPQQTLANGISEAEFLTLFQSNIAIAGTIFVGYNSIRFDDEFMRFLHYRNFYDAYEWQWQQRRSRWDLLDMVRMTRALRPEGIQWPFDSSGAPSNRLGLLTSINKLEHANAHDALSDVQATIALARLLKNKQPKLFNYLLSLRDKKKIAKLVDDEPFVYSSGKYPSEFEKTTVVVKLAEHPTRDAALVYDLRHDPEEFMGLMPEQLVERWKWTKDPEAPPRLPVKTLRFNVCPAIAPLNVFDEASQTRLQLPLSTVHRHLQKLQDAQDFRTNILQARELLDAKQAVLFPDTRDVDEQLYDGFIADDDKIKMRAVRAATTEQLQGLEVAFTDQRLNTLLPLFKARNYPQSLTDEERNVWEQYRERKLLGGDQESQLAVFMQRLAALNERKDITPEDRYVLEELNLYAQSIMPLSDAL